MNFKNIQTLLAKLGIFRSGSYEWSGDAKERPMEAIDDDIYNSKRDYVNKEDVKKVSDAASSAAKKTNLSSIMFWVFTVINILLLLILIMAVGFNFGTFLAIGFIALYFFLFKKGKLASTLKLIGIGIAITFTVFLSVSVFADTSDIDSDTATSTNNEEVTTTMMVATPMGKLLTEIASEMGANEYEIKPEEVSWTAANVALGLNDGQVMYVGDTVDVENVAKYFQNNNWITETIGFTYVAKDGSNSVGYMNTNTDDYQGAMCIIFYDQGKIACGFGPNAR